MSNNRATPLDVNTTKFRRMIAMFARRDEQWKQLWRHLENLTQIVTQEPKRILSELSKGESISAVMTACNPRIKCHILIGMLIKSRELLMIMSHLFIDGESV